MQIKLTIQGEPDISPLVIQNQYSKADEAIFSNLVQMIKDKLERNLRININECITLYSAFAVSELRNGKTIQQIQQNAPGLLRPEQVMIGVPESLRKMSFELILDDAIPRQIVLETPIHISNYIMGSA
jgi:urease subunit gamma